MNYKYHFEHFWLQKEFIVPDQGLGTFGGGNWSWSDPPPSDFRGLSLENHVPTSCGQVVRILGERGVLSTANCAFPSQLCSAILFREKQDPPASSAGGSRACRVLAETRGIIMLPEF